MSGIEVAWKPLRVKHMEAASTMTEVMTTEPTAEPAAGTQLVALNTGGGTGIGRATALGLAERGWQVQITGRREAPLAEVAATHPVIGYSVGDVSDQTTARRIVERTGAGITGLALANGLSGRGIDVTVVEQAPVITDARSTAPTGTSCDGPTFSTPCSHP